MDSIIYKNKYLKYKNKYLELKIKLKGGGWGVTITTFNILTKYQYDNLDDEDSEFKKYYDININEDKDDNKYAILKKVPFFYIFSYYPPLPNTLKYYDYHILTSSASTKYENVSDNSFNDPLSYKLKSENNSINSYEENARINAAKNFDNLQKRYVYK